MRNTPGPLGSSPLPRPAADPSPASVPDGPLCGEGSEQKSPAQNPLHAVGRVGARAPGRGAILLWCLALLSLLNCTGELPLSDLINNTITLKVLGTYESNNPYGFATTTGTTFKDDVITGATITGTNTTLVGAPPNIVSYANGLVASDFKYYIDLAEIRLAQGQGKSSSQTISDYWSQFAISRQLMCSDYNTADGRNLANCIDSNGQQRLADFFNGGFTYPAVDVKSGNFNHLGIYFRRFVAGSAARFDGAGTYFGDGTKATAEASVTAAFDNRTIYGLDVENILQVPYGATSTEPLMFPLQRKDLSLSIVDDHEPYTMEVRIFIKNLMMVHVLQVTGNAAVATDPSNSAFVYVAPADWNINHAYQDLTNQLRQGGSILMTARVYQPAKVGSIVMTNSVATTTNASYYVVVPSGTVFSPLSALPYASTSASTSSVVSNLPPGAYDVYRTCDKFKCGNASTAGTCDVPVSGTDGFPETAVQCNLSAVTVPTGTTVGFDVSTCPAIASCS